MSLRRLWRGDIPLEEAFWTYAVLGGIAVNVATSFAFLILISMNMPVCRVRCRLWHIPAL